jgi:hypothetical protein
MPVYCFYFDTGESTEKDRIDTEFKAKSKALEERFEKVFPVDIY